VRQRRPMMGCVAMIGVMRIKGCRVSRGWLIPKSSVIVFRPVGVKFRMYGGHIAEPDIVTSTKCS